MFYSPELLAKRDSGFGLLWLAATLGSKSTLKKLTKKSVLTADITHLCDMIRTPSEPLALRLSSNLMVGVARVYKLKHEIFVTDVTAVYSTLKKANDLANSMHAVDPKSLQMKKGSAAVDKITLAVEGDAFMDLEFDAYAFSWNVPNEAEEGANAAVIASQSSKSAGRNRALHTIDESHLQSTSMDDAFDPLDSFDLGNQIGDGGDPFDLGLGLELGWDPQPDVMPVDHDVDMGMDGDAGLGVDVANDQIMYDRVSEEPVPGSAQKKASSVLGADEIHGSSRKRRRDENDEDSLLDTPTRPRSILASPRILADVGNFMNDTVPLGEDIQPDDFQQDAAAEPVAVEPAAAESKPKTKRGKKQVRILLDARTELTDKELKDARENYIQEQMRLRLEMEQQQFNKDAVEKVHELLFAPPAIFEAEPLRELWANTFLAQIEPKTGTVTLVNAPAKKRARKRRRIEESEADGERGDEVEMPVGDDGMLMDIDQNPFFGEDDLGNMNGDDQAGPFVLGSDRIRSSEEPEQARAAASPMPSLLSIEMHRGRDVDFNSQHSGIFPWDNAAPSSSANEQFPGSIGSRGSLRRSIPGVADTHIELRSLSGSRRSSPVSGHRQGDSPGFAADLPDAPLDDYRLSVDEGEGAQPGETQLTEFTQEALERNALNFLTFSKIQKNLKGSNEITLNDLIGDDPTPHVAANGFYNCLVLATKNLLRLRQAEPFGVITLELME